MKQIKFIGILFILTAVLLAACEVVEPTADLTEREINVVTTIGMIADIVENVGGERVEVSNLMGPGIDPHLYKASEGDVTRMSRADVIFYNGLLLEAQMGEVLAQMDGRIITVAVAEGIDPSQLLPSEEYEGQYDPHVWFDVQLWMIAAEVVRDTLIDMDPQSQAYYEQNAADYLSQLETLHAYVLDRANAVPEVQRVLITAHDAFQYFGAAYNFDVRGLQGISTEAEAGTGDIRDLAEFIVEREINAIFIETSVPDRNIQAVQAAVQSRGHDVEIGGELYSDAMGSPGSGADTYDGMVRHNIDTIVNALLED